MSSYIGRHAELYDLFYADKPYAAEAEFVHQCIQKHGEGSTRRMLELACGTGNHALEFERQGYEVTASDYSTDMLAQAKAKGKRNGSGVVFVSADMRALEFPDHSFDAVVCLFDSIGYVATNDALRKVIQGIHRCLRPGGLFIVEFWHAAAMLRGFDPLRLRRWSTTEGEVIRVSQTTMEPALQLAHVAYSVYELKHDGSYSELKETQTNRFFLLQEMNGWLEAGGFAPVESFAGFTGDNRITSDTWHIVSVARSR